jgi:hypothetical protein
MVEIIWTPSETHFLHDMNILQMSDAKIKIVIVNPAIYAKQKLVRMFQKTRISEMQKGNFISDMLDGKKVLEDENYLTDKVKTEILELINQSKAPLTDEIERLKADIFSETELSPILSRCIGLSKKLKVPNDRIKWLENELYGYQSVPEGETSSDQPLWKLYPHDPEYRYIEGEVRIVGGYDETMGERIRGIKKYPLFFAHQISRLEELSKVEEFFINFDMDDLSDSTKNVLKKYSPGTRTMPVVYKTQAFRRSVETFRLHLHRFLDGISQE